MERIKKINEIKYFYGNPSNFFNSGKLYFDKNIETTDLAIISIPNDTDIQEITELISDNFLKYIIKIQVVKTEIPKYYTLIINFSNKEIASKFYLSLNNKKIDIFEENYIIIRKISKYVINKESKIDIINEKCSICLENYKCDSLPIMLLCGHKFHNFCLKRWNEDTCPLCRYEQHPTYLYYCDKCNNCENIWMCIICGFLGCGGEIPIEGHISEHSYNTSHIFSKLINSNNRNTKIFDHSVKDFIDRLYINSENGIIGMKIDKKEESKFKINIDLDNYNDILTYNLENQRKIFKKQIKNIEENINIKKEKEDKKIKILKDELNDLNLKNHNYGLLLKDLQSIIKDEKEKNNKKNIIVEKLEEELNKLKLEYEKNSKKNNFKEKIQQIKLDIKSVTEEIKDLEIHIKNSSLVNKSNSKGSSLFIL